MSGVLSFQRSHEHSFDAGIVNRARHIGAWLVVQPGHALLNKPPLPLGDGLPVQRQLGRHFRVLLASAQVSAIRALKARTCAVFGRVVSDVGSSRSFLNAMGDKLLDSH